MVHHVVGVVGSLLRGFSRAFLPLLLALRPPLTKAVGARDGKLKAVEGGEEEEEAADEAEEKDVQSRRSAWRCQRLSLRLT